MYGSREEGDSKVKFHRMIPLNASCTLVELPNTPAPAMPRDPKDKSSKEKEWEGKWGFQVITETKSFTVYAESSELKREWTDALHGVIYALQQQGKKNKLTRSF
jgi:hypothetical protein